MSNDTLCPFSKPILGNFCQCQHARAVDRCAGKMSCGGDAASRRSCHELVSVLKEKGRFILGANPGDSLFTHAQLMKLRCGALRGMQRVLKDEVVGTHTAPPAVLELIDLAEQRFGSIEDFPFGDIVQDIRAFSHRKRARSTSQ